MASVQEYLERKSDEELRGMLHSYCMGVSDLTVDTVLLICNTLALRDSQLPDPYALFLSLCRMYS